MNRSTILVAVLAGALALPAWAQQPALSDLLVHPSKMVFPDLSFKVPRAKRLVAKNGVVLFLLEEHELPLVTMRALIRTGSYTDPADKLGLAEITGSVMRTGGTEKMIGDQIDEELEYMAASVETYVGEEAGVATLSVLKKDLDRGLSIFSEVLMRPAFAHDKVELKKNQVIEGIRRRNDKAAWIVQREWKRLVFQGHPFGRISTVKTVTAIAREDLIRFHQQFYYPNNISLVVSGDFVEADLLKKLEGVFGAWPSRPAPALPAPQVPLAFRASVNHIEKDVPQASIRLGHLGVTKLDPDWHALEVFDNVLGSNGFSSRLMREVRSNRGLAYSVGSGVTGGRSRGVILAACQTKSKSCVEALDLIMQILRQIRTQPVSVEELKIARESLLNSFVFQFTSSYGIATAHADLEYLGLPTDWYDTYKDRIARVTADDVLRVARQHLHPDKLTILVVGKQAEFDRPLATLGKVTQLPLDDYTGR